MTFVNPILAGVGLACVAIPILIHILMRRRRRPVAWGAMRFLLEAYRQQRRRMNLEQVLLLASRCLLVALLALALGKPMLGAAGLLGVRVPRTAFIVLDNGLTAGLAGEGSSGRATALDRLRERALEIISGLDAAKGDTAALITLGEPADLPVFPPSSDLAGVAQAIKGVEVVSSRADVAGAMDRLAPEVERATREGRGATVYLLSEFREGSCDTRTPPPGARALGARLVAIEPATRPAGNVAIAGIHPLQSILVGGSEGSGETVPVRVELRRFGQDAAGASTTKVRLELAPASAPADDPGAALAAVERIVRWSAGEEGASVVLGLMIPPAAAKGQVVLRARVDRDALEGDDRFTRPMEARERLRVALVAPARGGLPATIDRFTPADWIGLALAPGDDGSLRTRRAGDVAIVPVDASRDLNGVGAGVGPLAGCDAVVIPIPQAIDAGGWARVRRVLDQGALVVVTPPPGETVHAWAEPAIQALGLDWTVAPEARTLTKAMTLVPGSRGGAQEGVLALLHAEIEELCKAVSVTKVLPISLRAGSAEVPIALEDGTPMMVVGAPGRGGRSGEGAERARGAVVLVAVAPDLSWTDLPAKPLFLPLMQETIRQGAGLGLGSRVVVAGTPAVFPPGTAELERVRAEGSRGEDRVGVDAAGRALGAIRHAGVWRARSSSGLNLATIAVNHDVNASRVEPGTKDQVARWLQGYAAVEWEADGPAPPGATAGAAKPQAPPFSFPLLLAAGVVALLEIAFARFFSHARVDEATAPVPGRAAA